MSLKSFDKFCENMILSEPKSEKAIFDERQKIVRSQLTAEALIVYVFLSAVNVFIMEASYQWCESYFATLVLAAAVSLMWWTIRCAAKGVLFGVNGTFSIRYVGAMWIGLGLCNVVMEGCRIEYLYKDGMIAEKLVMLVSFGLLAVCGIISLIVASAEDKRHKKENEYYESP